MSENTFPRLTIAGFVLIIFVLVTPALTQTQTRPNEPKAIDLIDTDPAKAAKAGDRKLAIADDQKLLADDANNVIAENNLGALYFAASRYEEAADLIVRAADARPDVWQLQVNASVALAQSNNYAAGLRFALVAIKLAPKELRPRQQLCEMYLAVHDTESAVPCFEALVKDDAAELEDHLNYGEALVMAGDSARAVPVLQDVIKASPRLAPAYNALGMAQYREKRYKDSVDSLRQAVSLAPDAPSYRYNMAVVEMATRDNAGALTQYNLLKQSDPKLADQLYKAMFADKIVVAH